MEPKPKALVPALHDKVRLQRHTPRRVQRERTSFSRQRSRGTLVTTPRLGVKVALALARTIARGRARAPWLEGDGQVAAECVPGPRKEQAAEVWGARE